MKYNRTAVFAAGFAALTLLTACGGQEKSAAPAPAPAPAESTAQAAESSAAPAGSTDSAEITKPGTELKVGDRAVVPFKYGTKQTGTIAITVDSIDVGPASDLAAVGEKAKGLVPVYIRLTVENVGGTDLAHSTVRLRAQGPDGRSTGVVVTGDIPKCKSDAAPKDFTKAGAKYETCELQAIREGSSVGAATYTDTENTKDEPIVWKK
ncbi:hypothetical protein ACPZ19_06900 [Amycolatopsis lurida]